MASGAQVILAGRGFSDDALGVTEPAQALTLTWEQITGPSVSLSLTSLTSLASTELTSDFIAPTLAPTDTPVDLTFRLHAFDGAMTMSQEVTVTVLPSPGPEISVTGNGVEIANGDTTPDSSDHTNFGTIYALGGQVSRSFTIQNSGTAVLAISGITVSDTTNFTLSGVPATVAAGASGSFAVTYAPQTAMTHSANVTITSDDADEGTFSFAVEGSGGNEAPRIAVGPDQTVAQGDTVTLNGSGATDTALGANEPLQPMTLSWQQVSPASPLLALTSPTATGTGSATIASTFTAPVVFETTDFVFRLLGFDGVSTQSDTVIVTVDASIPIFRVIGNGQAIANGDTTPSQSDHTDFGHVAAGAPLSRTFEIRNDSGATLALAGVSVAGEAASEISVTTNNFNHIPGGGSASFTVEWTPISVGPRTAVLSVHGTAGGLYHFSIAATASNTGPTAQAGADQRVASGAAVALDGSASSDPDAGQALFHSWVETSRTVIVLTGADTATPTFTAPVLGAGSADAVLTFELTVSDGITSDTDSVTVTVDAPPTVAIDLPVGGSSVVNAAEAGSVALAGSVSDVADGQGVSVVVSDGSRRVSGSAVVASNGWRVVLDLSGLEDGPLSVVANVSDAAGNPAPQASAVLTKDTVSPSGYGVSFDQGLVNSGNAAAVGFRVTAGEVGASYTWTINSSGGGTAVSGSGTLGSADQQVRGIDLSGLGDGTLTLRVVLTDLAGNAGAPAEATANKDSAAPDVLVSGPSGAQSDPFTITITFSKPVTGFAPEDVSLVNGSLGGFSGGGADYSFVLTPDHDGTVTVFVAAGVTADASANPNAVSNLYTVEADLTGSEDPVPPTDGDGDGLPDAYESTTTDRDGDGIPDAQDYDPQGYFYCEDDGRILSGGGITVAGPSGTNSAVGTLNDIRIVQDGSSGEYQWFALRPGLYRVTYRYPTAVGVPSTSRLVSGTLDVTSLLPSNPAVLGSQQFGSTGFLAAGDLAANPAFHAAFDIAPGDPHVIGNNIPMTQCAQNDVTIATAATGAEANGGTPTPARFTVSQGRVSGVDTVVSYDLSGSATAGADFAALSGSVTIRAGQTSADIVVSVLEDGLIERAETVVITLTGIPSADATTQLSATAGNLTAQSVIADDDIADVIVVNADLVAREGQGGDTASMRFALAGQPTADVTFYFSGDSQCSVAPATMTFDSQTYASLQSLTITAIDDEIVEGPHVCQPRVTISSADARFDGFVLALAQVTIADDLVDTIRDPLGAALQSDFSRAVSQQSRRFATISRGGLGRLQAGVDETHCGTLSAFDVDGSLHLGVDGGNSSGVFGEDFYSCQTGVRHIVAGGFSVAMVPGLGSQGMVHFSVQRERQRAGTDLRGWFWGGYLSRNTGSGQAQGQVDGVGVNAGIYGAHAFGNGLYLDYYGAGSIGHHRYRFTFSDPLAPITARGAYSYAALFAGVAVSGRADFDRFSLTPRMGFNVAYAAAGDASVSASQLGLTSTGRIALQPVNGYDVVLETLFTINGPGNRGEERPRGTMIDVAPRLHCERGFESGRVDCGYGGSLRLSNADPNSDLSFELLLDAERTGGRTNATLEISRSRRILQGAATLETSIGIDQSRQPNARVQFDWRF